VSGRSGTAPGRSSSGAGELPQGWRLERRAEISQGDIAYDILGEGPPVLLVHGTPSWSYLWRNVAPALAGSFSVYIFDLPGYGDSFAPPEADLSLASHSTVLVELLEHWGLENPAVAGHDIGGGIVLRTHLIHRRAFERIALVDAVVLAPWITPTTRHIQEHLEAYRTMPPHIFEQIVATHLGTAVHRRFDAETLAAYLRPWQGEDGRAAYLQKVERFDETDTTEFEDLLGTIQVPVQIVWGEADAWLDPRFATRIRDLIPGAEVTSIPHAGHFVMEDAPAEVAQTLEDFFRR
jgi:pimeloyl-ACP methyl ester carboxylesterase